MKTIKFILLGLLLSSFTMQSQVSVNVNLGKPPVWAPADRVEVQYYYLPEVDVYYDVPAQRFIYIRNGRWHHSAALPAKYRGYNLNGANIVYLTDYRGNAPYKFHKSHKAKYGNRGNAYVVKQTKHKNNSKKATGKGKARGKGNKN
ncbi:hypothetical protein [Flavobacterium sp. UBA6135]|uniref:hypothetical protein n=1 Tax=Flavobacterium sp. UBA6135 TaxID=1946553 RepID=UPI0025C3BAC1|nr:hypothetical protein [Flavobacterium sp. UBA6135]